jgi:hypothetical protein
MHTGSGERCGWVDEPWIASLRRAMRSLALRRDFKEQVLRRIGAGARFVERDRGDPRKGDVG